MNPVSPLSRALSLSMFLGCASRAVPDAFPSASAASPEAREPAAPVAAVALQSEPPLPGESAPGWPGLSADGAAAPDPHAHHHHPGMVMPASPPDAGVDPHAGHHHAP